MAGLFSNWFKPKVKYHEGLPPKERIARVFEDHVLPELAKHGFTFDPKQLSWKIVMDDVTVHMEHKLSKYNTSAGSIEFHPWVTMYSHAYRDWSKRRDGKGHEGIVYVGALLHLHDPKGLDAPYDLDLGKGDNERIVQLYKKLVVDELLPLARSLSTLQGVLAHKRRVEKVDNLGYIAVACAAGDMAEAERALVLFERSCNAYTGSADMKGPLEKAKALVKEHRA
jgi:hypothetical protein